MRNEIMFLLGIAMGLLFLTGFDINFGFGEADPTTIPVPQSNIAGWACIVFGILWLCPPWTISKIARLLRRLVKGRAIDTKRIKERLKDAETSEVT